VKRTVLAIAAVILTARASQGATCSPSVFIDAVAYPVGAPSSAMVVADFNHDGFPDIATVSSNYYYGQSFSILLGNPDGTFQTALTTPLSLVYFATSIAAGLVDNDANVDLVLGTSDGNVTTLLGNGDGTFQPPLVSAFTNPPGISAIALANINPGGTLDVVAVGSSGVSTYSGNGDGTFAPPVLSPGVSGSSLAVGDVNGDGKLDVASANNTNAVAVWFGNGDGTFSQPSLVAGGLNLLDVHLADLDSDGHLDIVAVSGQFAAVMLGNGDGSFQAALNYPAGPAPFALAIGDFDGDGIPDLAVANQGNNGYATPAVWILAGQADGSFVGKSAFTPGLATTAIAAADFGNDGRVDLAVTDPSEIAVEVLLGNGDLTFQAVSTQALGSFASALASADFNGDGELDLATIQQQTSVVVFLGGPGPVFVARPAIPFTEQLVGLISADFNGDGRIDIIAVGYSGSVWLLEGDGDGTFQAPVVVSTVGYGAAIVTEGDFNGDGIPDLAITGPFSGPGWLTQVLLGTGTGSFQAPIPNALPSPVQPDAVIAADFDADGHLDLAMTTSVYGFPGPAGSLSVLLGMGDGTFASPLNSQTGQNPTSLAAADFTGDGVLDIAVADNSDGTIALFIGNGDGSMGNATYIGKGWRPNTLVAADFDGDGNADILTANPASNNVSLLLGVGNGRFQSPVSLVVGYQPGSLVVGDVSGNGSPGAVVANTGGLGGLSLLIGARLGVAPLPPLGACSGTAAHLRVFANGFGPVGYQWRKGGVDLVDGGTISGAKSATLTIDPASVGDSGDYDVVVTDSCTTVTSNLTSFTVTDPPSQPTLLAPASVAPGLATTAAVANPQVGHTYTWAVTGATISAGQGTSQVTFVAPLPGAMTLQVTDFGAPGCGTASTIADVPVDYLDVAPSNPFHADIVTIAQAGITAGCGGGNYCPTSDVSRAQMAVFLLKAKNGSSYVPPVQGPFFIDVPNGAFAADWINQLYAIGVTRGCGNGNYCPDGSVTRAQMAVFLLKTLVGGYYNPDFGPQVFGDVPQFSFAANYILDLYNRGITGGCSASPLLYCPDNPVNRGQMAVFLVRTFLTP
jgi:hypothetical protein